MTAFGSVSGVYMGAQHLLRTLHADAMKRFREAPRDERERYAEQAAKYRDMMDRVNMARTLGYVVGR